MISLSNVKEKENDQNKELTEYSFIKFEIDDFRILQKYEKKKIIYKIENSFLFFH